MKVKFAVGAALAVLFVMLTTVPASSTGNTDNHPTCPPGSVLYKSLPEEDGPAGLTITEVSDTVWNVSYSGDGTVDSVWVKASNEHKQAALGDVDTLALGMVNHRGKAHDISHIDVCVTPPPPPPPPPPVRGITANAAHSCEGGLVVTITNTGELDEVVSVNGIEVEVPAGETVEHTFDLPAEDTGWVVYVDWLRGDDDTVWIGTFEDIVDCVPPPTTPTTTPNPPPTFPPADKVTDPIPASTLPVTGAGTWVVVGAGLFLAALGLAFRGVVRWARVRIEP